MKKQGKQLYSLIPLDEFKALLSVDDRDNSLSRFCLVAATHTIEQYCKRRLLVRRYWEHLAFWGDRVIPLGQYPARKIFAVYVASNREPLEADSYRLAPEAWEGLDVPGCLVVSPWARLSRGERSLSVVYRAGYSAGNVPADLACACMELAAWNFTRYKGRGIGVTASVRGKGERLELSMPENVKLLLQAYIRKAL